MARRFFVASAGLFCFVLAAAQFPVVGHASGVDRRPTPPEFKFVSDSLFPAMHDPARAPWVLERLRPVLAKFPNHAPFRQIEFWALANTGASAGALASLTDSLVGGTFPSGRREPPGRLQQATHCLELGQVLFARCESLTVAEAYLRRAIRYVEPTHSDSLRAACEDLLAEIGRAKKAMARGTRSVDCVSFATLRSPTPSQLGRLHVKLTFIGARMNTVNSLVLHTEGSPVDIDPAAACHKSGVDYTDDADPLVTVTVTSSQMQRALDSLATIPSLVDGDLDTLGSIAVVVLDSNGQASRVFDSIIDKATAGVTILKLQQALATNDSAVRALSYTAWRFGIATLPKDNRDAPEVPGSAHRALDDAVLDCNHNQISDRLDISQHRSEDRDRDGIPDECEPALSPSR